MKILQYFFFSVVKILENVNLPPKKLRKAVQPALSANGVSAPRLNELCSEPARIVEDQCGTFRSHSILIGKRVLIICGSTELNLRGR